MSRLEQIFRKFLDSQISVDFLGEIVPRNQIVFRPDHPLLLRGPDALIGGPENICAVFEPHSIEFQNPAHLITRLMSARLALPRFARTVLILGRDEEMRFSGLESEFGLTTNRSDRSLRRFLSSPTDFGNSRPMEFGVQASAGKSFDRSMAIVNFAYRLERVTTDTIEKAPAFKVERVLSRKSSTGQFHYRPRNRVSVDGVEASLLSARNRPNLARQLSATISGHLLDTYALDSGVPYPKRIMHTHMAVAVGGADLVTVRGKEVQAAAFLGIALLPTDKSNVVRETVSHHRNFLLDVESGISG